MEGECLVEMIGGGDADLWWRLGSLTASAPVLASLELHDRMLPGGGDKKPTNINLHFPLFFFFFVGSQYYDVNMASHKTNHNQDGFSERETTFMTFKSQHTNQSGLRTLGKEFCWIT